MFNLPRAPWTGTMGVPDADAFRLREAECPRVPEDSYFAFLAGVFLAAAFLAGAAAFFAGAAFLAGAAGAAFLAGSGAFLAGAAFFAGAAFLAAAFFAGAALPPPAGAFFAGAFLAEPFLTEPPETPSSTAVDEARPRRGGA